jgi:hypothetical protein
LVLRFIEPLPGSPAETFGELFKAAQVLLREHITDEDKIIPTLLAANNIDLKNTHIVEVVDGIRILKWEPISAQLVWEPIFSGLVWDGASQHLVSRSWKKDRTEPLTRRWKSRSPWSESTTDQARPDRAGVLIRVYPHKEAISPKEVASRYKGILTAQGLPFGRSRDALLEYEFTGGYLCLLVASGKPLPGRNVSFPAPRLVEAFCVGVLEESEDHLVMRRAGPDMDPENLIPACVGFLLKASGRMEGRKGVEQLLDDYVFGDIPWKSLNEGGYPQRHIKKTQFWGTNGTIRRTLHPKIERLLNGHAF